MRLIALGLILFLPAAALAQPAPQAVPVGVVAAAKQPVTQGIEFVGRVEAIQKVDVQARVSGYLASVDFTEGSTVKEGDRLYTIDQLPFQAALQQARGALLQAQAQATNAGLARRRAEELVKTSATSVATRDQRVAEEQTAQGQVIEADAAMQTAAINLSYTIITAPIAGRIGRTVITKGNLVTPQTGTLTTIVSQDPVYVAFPVSQREFLKVENGTQLDTGGLSVRVRLADGTEYSQPGRINFVNVTVDKSTDTVLVRATVPNPKGTLVDGQFVRLRVEGDQPADLLVIPQAALVIDQQGAYVFVAEGGRAVVRRVTTGEQIGRSIAIKDGLQPGDQVIVDGISLLRPGAPVIAAPVKGT
jgi:membrane fusion protein (multidrug efflux system)